jgi:hypothetical protein
VPDRIPHWRVLDEARLAGITAVALAGTPMDSHRWLPALRCAKCGTSMYVIRDSQKRCPIAKGGST